MPDGVNIPGGPSFAGTPQPPDVPCDPTGEAWRGPPGPAGPQGVPGPRTTDVANVLDYGADPAGSTDSTSAIRAAIATGKNVWLPAGTYLVTGRLSLGSLIASQSMNGDGLGTTLLIDGRFDPSVTDGVIVLTGINQTDQRPMISDIDFKFEQPADIVTTTTVASGAGGNTITVASATGIVTGMAVYDVTATGAIPSTIGGTSSLNTTVSSIAGNVITLSANVAAPGVGSGDSIHFAPVRSMFKTLAAGGTATPGGTGVQYPWAIYCSGNVQTLLIDNVMLVGAWNGIYVRGSSFQLGTLNINAFNIGIDVDNCLNFCSIVDYRFWNWGYGPADPYGQARQALLNVYYDGTTVAANLGRCDGVAVANFGSWFGSVNLTSTWTWGTFVNLETDGNHANLNIAPAGTGWVQISNWYSTKGSRTIGPALSFNPTNAAFLCVINNAFVTSASITNRGITQFNGRLAINGGYVWHGLGAVRTMIEVAGGSLELSNLMLDASAARTDTYIHLQGVATIQMAGCIFTAPAGAGAIGVLVATDSALVSLNNITWNGWTWTLPAAATGVSPAGSYQAVGILGPVTVAQLNVGVPAGPNVRAGTGAASGTQPSGSLWLRTDGSAGARMYVSQGGGTWVPVASV